ncbi:MAG: hypothetical protein AAGB03_10870 [Pseudomonadota bacterium]
MPRLVFVVAVGLLVAGPAFANEDRAGWREDRREAFAAWRGDHPNWRPGTFDRIEDRWDRRENRIDRRVTTGPLDLVEDRIDRREDVRDRRQNRVIRRTLRD